MMDSVFQLANARRAKALNQPDTTPAKVGQKRGQKSTPVNMTPTPTPGQKHFKAKLSPDMALKKLSFGDESSTDAPAGPNRTGERGG